MTVVPTLHRHVATARAWFALAVIALLLLAVVTGIAFTVASALADEQRAHDAVTALPTVTTATPKARTASRSAEDELAAAQMVQLPASAARPQALIEDTARPSITLPPPTRTEELVPTGFPHTPEGAVAQLAAIDSLALRDLTPAQVRAAHRWAATPGAVPLHDWTPYVAASAALDAAGLPEGSADVASTFTPVAGLIKGSIGTDFVVACVLGEWQVTYRATSRAGAADCQRMVWSGGRWRIGPGAQPAYAPSAWPGSADAVRAGWRGLNHA